MTKVYDNATDLITFARSSSGTALRRVGYGDELMGGSDGSDASDWSAARSNSTVTSDGVRIRSTSVASGAYGPVQQLTGLTVGNVYRYTADVFTAGGAGTYYFRIAAIANLNAVEPVNETSLTDFSPEGEFVATNSTMYVGVIHVAAAAGDYVEIDNISVKEVIFDRATDDLVLFNHPDDVPRIEYDGSDGSLKGLLIEEQRTNLITYSEEFSQSYWAKGVSGTGSTPVVTASSLTDPAGGTGAYQVEFDAGAGTAGGDLSMLQTSGIGQTVGVDYTHSIWVRGDVGGEQIVVRGVANGAFDLFTLTTDWTRISATETATSTVGYLNFGIRQGVNGTINSSATVHIYGAQLEAGSFPTSYIPTSGGQSTRSPDIASIPVSAFGYNQQAGTVVVEFDTVGGAETTDVHYVLSGDSTNARWAYHNSANILQAWDGQYAPLIMSNQDDLPVKHKFAVASDASSVSTASGGSVTAANVTSTGNLPALTTAFVLGSSHTDANQLNGHMKSLKYYPRRLTDAQLQELTS